LGGFGALAGELGATESEGEASMRGGLARTADQQTQAEIGNHATAYGSGSGEFRDPSQFAQPRPGLTTGGGNSIGGNISTAPAVAEQAPPVESAPDAGQVEQQSGQATGEAAGSDAVSGESGTSDAPAVRQPGTEPETTSPSRPPSKNYTR